MTEKTLDFDASGEERTLDFVRTFFEHSWTVQRTKNDEFERIYKMYKLYQDMTGRDPNRSNLVIPKLYGLVETIMPEYVEAILGLRPYIPVELYGQNTSDIAQAQTDLLDAFLHDSNFYWEMVKHIKMAILYGTAFIESVPQYTSRRIKSKTPVYSQDYYGNRVLVDIREEVKDIVEFGLKIRAFAPWEIYRDPNASTIEDSRGILKWRGRVSARQIREMVAMSPDSWPGFDPDKLKFDMAELSKDEWGRRMATELGVPVAQEDDDLGIWLSYESGGRYIDLWNFSSIMRDIDNPYFHRQVNLTRTINTDDPNPDNAWFGIGEGRPVEGLCYALNTNYRQMFDNHNMLGHGVLFYDDEALNVDQLVMIAGNRIPVSLGAGRTIQDHVFERATPVMSPDFYRVPSVLDGLIDETSGIYDMLRGQAPEQSTTAREAILRTNRGGQRLKLKIKLGENLGLKGLGEKTVSIIDQFATPDDIARKIGFERAMLLPSVNPSEIDGGYEFAFKGSSRMLEIVQKRQDAKDIYQLMAGNFSIRQDWLANFLLQIMDVTEKDRRKAVVPDLQAMQLQMIMAQATGNAGQGSETTRAVSNGSTIGTSGGYPMGGRDVNEKLRVS